MPTNRASELVLSEVPRAHIPINVVSERSKDSPRKKLNFSDSYVSERKMSPLSPEMRRRINSNDKNDLSRSKKSNNKEEVLSQSL